MIRQIKLAIVLLFLGLPFAAAEPPHRFFIEGDGRLRLSVHKKGRDEVIAYRQKDGNYSDKALQTISRLFGIPPKGGEEVSLRLIGILDHLEDHFHAGRVEIISGFRSREHNRRLRKRGLLAGSVSLHLDGMAADVELEGVSARKTWEYLRGLNCCGAGYYHGGSIHLDVGPVRFWDEKTSGVEKGPPPANKLVIVRTDRDIYRAGEMVRLKLARVSDYPFGVSSKIRVLKGGRTLKAGSLEGAQAACQPITGPDARTLSWRIPENFHPQEKLTLEITFCDSKFSEMPKKIRSNGIEIKS